MTTLIITRGLPGSGKTTHARAWVAGDREHRARVNRDDIRSMLDDGEFIKGVTEPRILAARDALILGLLGKGLDVICDDTNLPQRTARDLFRLAKRAGAAFAVYDYTDVPLDVCIARDAARADKKPVGEAVIRDMHQRYLKGRDFPLPQPEEPQEADAEAAPYEPKPGTPKAIMVDIGGTVALHGARSPYDESRVHEDRPNRPVIAVVREMARSHDVVFLSGRTDACRAATVAWLDMHTGVPYELHMRPAGDMRKDAIVKRELFDGHIRERFDVTCVLDDRKQCVDLWRSLGLTCLAVADGDF